MSLRIVPVALLCLALGSCGVKTGLDRPMGQIVQPQAQGLPQQQALQNRQKDPSKPPTPLGEPGGTTPPYTTGP